MNKLVIASSSKGAGKTSVIIGMALALGRKIGYMKPFGDRLLYKKKRLWDYDSALVTHFLNLKESPEDMSIGFEHSKLRYMYNQETIRKKLDETVSHTGKEKDTLFVESGMELTSGASVYLDALSIVKDIGGKLIVVMSGDDDFIVDNIAFCKKYVDMSGVSFEGIIINKIKDTEDFKNTHIKQIEEMGVKILGIVPYAEELSYFSMGFLADCLFAKVIAGEAALNNEVKRILIGAMSADNAMSRPVFKEGGKLVITGGDRTGMILAAVESDAAGIILTNNILPSSHIISKVAERNIPMLLVAADTYKIVKQIDLLEPLITKSDSAKATLLEKLIKENVNLSF